MKIKILCISILLVLVMPLFTMTALANQPPSAPEIEGPASGTAGEEISYGFCSTDPEGSEISFCIDWGEGAGAVCIGPFPSGTCAQIPHTWSSQGTYVIKATAKDPENAESPESTKTVTMPRYRMFFAIMESFFQKYQNMLILLQILLSKFV